MSYILDALKKADSERKKGNAYASATLSAPYAMPIERNKTKMWYWLLALNFVILISILGISIYLYHAYFSKSTNQLTKQPSTQISTQASTQKINEANATKGSTDQNNEPAKRANITPDSTMKNNPIIDNSPVVTSGYPEKLDVHVFSKQPEKRFIMINGAVLMVGDKFDGWQLINIDVDGAEFKKDGQKVSVRAKP